MKTKTHPTKVRQRKLRAWSRLALCLGWISLTVLSTLAIVDINGNGLDDVWENFFAATGLVAGADADLDGTSNYKESIGGTDPFSSLSYLHPEITVTGSMVDVSWSGMLGKSYQLQSRTSLTETVWGNVGGSLLGADADLMLTLSTDTQQFFRVEVSDLDTDLDFITDWAERKMAGFSHTDGQSTGTNDFITLSNALSTAVETVTVEAVDPAAFEDSGSPAKFRIKRTGPLAPITVNFTLGGFTNNTRGSASAGDYNVTDSGGGTLAGSISLPFGSLGADVVIEPVADATVEVPEVVTLAIDADAAYAVGPDSASAEVLVCDAPDTPENEKLFFAYINAKPGVQTTASGYSVLFLSGDNARARITVFPVTSGHLTSGEDEKEILSAGGGLVELFVEKNSDGTVMLDTNDTPIEAVGTLVDYELAIDRMNLEGGAFTANQDFLDALYGTSIRVEVATDDHPTGELLGTYGLYSGSTELVVPADPPAIANLTGTNLVRDVARFLTQATFGPTEESISNLVHSVTNDFGGDQQAAYDAWIDNQFALEQSSIYDIEIAADNQEWELYGYGAYSNTLFPPYPPAGYTNGEPRHNNRRRAHWLAAIKAHDELRQRLAFAWSEIMVVSAEDTQVQTRQYGAAKYYDMLGENADDTFRELLEDVSYHPIMGTFLSSLKNEKAHDGISPDENYAREIMQLFSIGLIKLHLDGSLKLGPDGLPIPTYDNEDITEMARIFTGLSFSKYSTVSTSGGTTNYVIRDNSNFTRSNGNRYYGVNFEYPMKMFGDYHDTGVKTLFDGIEVNNTNAASTTIQGDDDLGAALDALASHTNTAPFISRRLIQRLVTSNPSAGYVYRVAAEFMDSGGDLKAVTKAILLDYEARSLDLLNEVGYGKQKEPLIRYIALLRAFKAYSQLPLSDLTAYGLPASQLDNFPPGTTRYRYGNTDANLGQTPLRAPSVFNWFLPDYTPGGAIATAGLKAPEFLITTETSVIQAVNWFENITRATQGVSKLPNETDGSLDNVYLDHTHLDTMYDAAIAGGATKAEAVALVVDYCDVLMMAGSFKARYEGAAEPNPRSIIIDAIASMSTTTINIVEDILYLMSTCPDYIIQK